MELAEQADRSRSRSRSSGIRKSKCSCSCSSELDLPLAKDQGLFLAATAWDGGRKIWKYLRAAAKIIYQQFFSNIPWLPLLLPQFMNTNAIRFSHGNGNGNGSGNNSGHGSGKGRRMPAICTNNQTEKSSWLRNEPDSNARQTSKPHSRLCIKLDEQDSGLRTQESGCRMRTHNVCWDTLEYTGKSFQQQNSKSSSTQCTNRELPKEQVQQVLNKLNPFFQKVFKDAEVCDIILKDDININYNYLREKSIQEHQKYYKYSSQC